jgi:hypothetical protein
MTDNLDISIENIDNQLEIFRAEERVRAVLAEANYKEYLASANRKTTPQGDEELHEFSLKVVDNLARGIADPSNLVSSKIPPKRMEDLGKATNEAPFSGMLGSWVKVVGEGRLGSLLRNTT